jgi:hypothetical protein
LQLRAELSRKRRRLFRDQQNTTVLITAIFISPTAPVLSLYAVASMKLVHGI